MTSHSIK